MNMIGPYATCAEHWSLSMISAHGLLSNKAKTEPAVRILMSLLGFDVEFRAGRALVALSRTCAMAGIDSDENRRAIGWALQATWIAIGAFRPRSNDELCNIRLEPMYLHEARIRSRLRSRPLAPGRAGRLRQLSQDMPGRIASAS